MSLHNTDYRLTASIHTLSMKTRCIVAMAAGRYPSIESVTTDENNGVTYLKINPNNFNGDIFNYSEYEGTLSQILNDCGLSQDSLQLYRIDLRLDSYDSEFYSKYAKLHRLLISEMSIAYNVRNRYRSCDLFSENQLSVAIMNSHFEVEYYDKYAESKGRENTKARLELRSKRWAKDVECVPCEFVKQWDRRFTKAMDSLQATLDKYNYYLSKQYVKEKDAIPVKFSNYSEFLLQNQDRIFTKKQLVDLLRRMKINNPEKAADNFIHRYKIELLKNADIKAAVNEILRAMKAFFEN